MILGLLILWYISGVASFIYWWTTDHDLNTIDLPFALFMGIIGPIGFVVGWSIHGKKEYKAPFVLISKRK